MKREDHVNLRKGQRVFLPRYGMSGVIKDVLIHKHSRTIGVGEISRDLPGRDYGRIIGEGLVYVPASEVELLGVVTA